jgi:hypothetical protein
VVKIHNTRRSTLALEKGCDAFDPLFTPVFTAVLLCLKPLCGSCGAAACSPRTVSGAGNSLANIAAQP